MTENAKRIWQSLRAAGMSEAGAAAMLGNMQAESALRADNAQDGMTGLSDAEYTRLTDMGAYPGFASDAVGYGLCQWTFSSRKAALLAFAKSRGVSVGDETMQAAFAVKELKADYSGLWKYLCSTSNLHEATSRICKEYERPAVNNIDVRYKAAQSHFNALSGVAVETPAPTPEKATEAPTFALTLRYLRKGMSGEDVRVWQYILKGKGFAVGNADGIFGEKTTTATKEYQRSIRKDPDGVVGPDTFGYAVGG